MLKPKMKLKINQKLETLTSIKGNLAFLALQI
jgi:hypothetical protein